jgi:hypothetical protein
MSNAAQQTTSGSSDVYLEPNGDYNYPDYSDTSYSDIMEYNAEAPLESCNLKR